MSLDDELRGAATMSRSMGSALDELRGKAEHGLQLMWEAVVDRWERIEDVEAKLETASGWPAVQLSEELAELNGEARAFETAHAQFKITLRRP